MGDAAHKLDNVVSLNVREQLVAEYKKLAEEQAKLEAKARELKAQKESLRERILPFLKVGTLTRIGRFEIMAREKSNGERVNVKDVRAVLPKSALKAFNECVSETKYMDMKVTLVDQVGELMDLAEESDS